MTARGWLTGARVALASIASAEIADREARLILAHVTGWTPARCATAGPEPLVSGVQGRMDAMLARRLAREPLAQILGQVPFYGRVFEVTADVLTPRPDTETIIDIALSRPFSRALDLGTGSGAIAITLLAERSGAVATATDISARSLDIAAQNAARHDVATRLRLQRADWWTGVEGAFDLIVSNPPYVSADAYAKLADEIIRFEPKAAVTPGGDGLAAYRAILASLSGRLKPHGRLLLEIGFDQGDAVATLCKAAGLDDIRVLPDINNCDRVVSAVRRAAADR